MKMILRFFFYLESKVYVDELSRFVSVTVLCFILIQFQVRGNIEKKQLNTAGDIKLTFFKLLDEFILFLLIVLTMEKNFRNVFKRNEA